GSDGTREDATGDLLQPLLEAEGLEVVRRVVPDDRDEIARAIEDLADDAAVVLTTGGTGLGPRDVTPEATASVLDRAAPGIAEAIRADSIAKTPHALLSRGVAGVRGRTPSWRATACRARTISSGSRWRWSGRGRWQWA